MFNGHIAQRTGRRHIANGITWSLAEYIISNRYQGVLLAEHIAVLADDSQTVHIWIHYETYICLTLTHEVRDLGQVLWDWLWVVCEMTCWLAVEFAETPTYFDDIDNGKFPIEYVEELSLDDTKKHHIIQGFRKVCGINLSVYFNRYQTNIFDDFPLLKEFISNGYFEVVDDNIKIKKEYFYVMDHFIEKLM